MKTTRSLFKTILFAAALAPFCALNAQETPDFTPGPHRVTIKLPPGVPPTKENIEAAIAAKQAELRAAVEAHNAELAAKADEAKAAGNAENKDKDAPKDKDVKDAKDAKDSAPAPAPAVKPEDETPEIKAVQKEISKLRLEKSLIDAKLALADAKRQEALAPGASERAELDAQRALRNARLSAENAAGDEEKAKIERQLALENAKSAQALAEKMNRIRELETEAKILKMESDNSLAKRGAEIAQRASEVALFQKQQEAGKVVAKEVKYLKEPLVNGTLYISDRRIPMNGPVTEEMARGIIQSMNFFNNQSTEYPIFIVIDNSPGGSVAAGFQILKAIESSKAPVCVVVKGFAASMAAVTTTLAPKSYCYNNTIILHHQMSTGFRGNMTVLGEQLETAKSWYDRLGSPVAKKMGITLEEFTKQMYEHTKTGDWQEFGDKAQQLKWVDTVVERIVEDGILDILPETGPRPPVVRPMAITNGCVEKIDDKGNRYIQLPILTNPADYWWISDRAGLYRAE